MLSIAEAPREVFAIGLVNARAGARAVIHRERAAQGGAEAADEGAGTGRILERETSFASGADNGDNRILPKHRLEEGCDCREIDG